MASFVAYYRVSTDRQGVSGLGLMRNAKPSPGTSAASWWPSTRRLKAAVAIAAGLSFSRHWPTAGSAEPYCLSLALTA